MSDSIDKYTTNILTRRYTQYRDSCLLTIQMKEECGLNIRGQNPPEDITENMTKEIIRIHEGDSSCLWAKGVNKSGDLISNTFTEENPIEVKAFSSDGPSQFGPDKNFGVLYFLDMRKWLKNQFVLWKVNLSNESPEWKNVKVNKTETMEQQCSQGRRPRIGWVSLYPQIKEHCVKVYEGTFEGIFIPPGLLGDSQSVEQPV
jgi:hypothetical protein